MIRITNCIQNTKFRQSVIKAGLSSILGWIWCPFDNCYIIFQKDTSARFICRAQWHRDMRIDFLFIMYLCYYHANLEYNSINGWIAPMFYGLYATFLYLCTHGCARCQNNYEHINIQPRVELHPRFIVPIRCCVIVVAKAIIIINMATFNQ